MSENSSPKERSSSPTEPEQPPLPMQTSIPIDDARLDIEHGRGGDDSAEEEEDDDDDCPVAKKRKVESAQEDLSPSDEDDCPLIGKSKLESAQEELSPSDEDDCPLIEKPKIASAQEDLSPSDEDDCLVTEKPKDLSPSNSADGIEDSDYSSFFNDGRQPNLEFDILDEFDSNDIMMDVDVSSYSTDSEDYEIPEDEIDALLDEGLIQSTRSKTKENDELAHEEREKIVLKAKGRDHFDVLPEGWIEVTHNSGMPVYLHKQSRVCCISKPYFLGPGSARKHEVPVSAIPCLHYTRELEKEKQAVENADKAPSSSDKEPSSCIIPSAKVECAVDIKKEQSLDHLTIREYCEKLFHFQTIKIKRFKTWSGRRKHMKMQKQRPTLPENTKLITCPLPVLNEKGQNAGNSIKREFIMNPVGKSAVCILHEYVQHTLRVQPRYVFKELENASTPYGAVVVINDMQFGSGYGSSKKQAKSEAAKSALDILIPNMNLEGRSDKEFQDVGFFDQVRVEDPRVCELCMKAGQPYPYQILLECLKRNYGMGNTDIHFEMLNLKHHKNEFKMTVGKHTATVICKNKRDGKQRASQAVLQLLHPQILSWGSLLRMYGIGSRQTMKEKKVEEQRITELQSKACANKPNISILNKLKEEMLKYRKIKDSLKPIGKLIPEEMQLVSTSDSNLNNVEL